MRKVLSALLVAGCFYSLFGTDSRVLTMGRTENFFMDDISVFRNPANVSIYPNMLMGSMGIYKQDEDLDSIGTFAGMTKYNRDPQKPFFGGILSYSLNQSADAGDQYPMLSIGMVFNRYDEMLEYLTPSSDKFFGADINYNYYKLQDQEFLSPVGKMDFLLGLALKNGAMIGLGSYIAFQKEKVDDVEKEEMRLIKINGGVNIPVAKTMDLEVSCDGSIMTQIGKVDTSSSNTLDSLITVADNDVGIKADVRLFSALSSLNGDFVPHLGVNIIKYHGGDNHIYGFDAGVGININIDRGFFWAGIEAFYEEYKSKYTVLTGDTIAEFESQDTYGGRVSFGIERNIIWDWLVWRVGATKKLAFQQTGSGSSATTLWIENPEADASDEDHVAFGFAINIENRLKIDAVMAEDMFYTFTNLLSGNHHHLMSRITATYSF